MSERQRNNSRPRGRPIALAPVILRLVLLLLAVGIPTGADRAAHADGAFPEAQSVLLPRDRPDEIILTTTFGLVSTEDGGSVWHFSCEAINTPMVGGGRYVIGPPPDDRIFAKTDVGIALSTNDACTWTIAGGALSSGPTSMQPIPFDIFPDPSDPMRVFTLAADAVTAVTYLFRSLDGGSTYSGPIFTAPDNSTLTGVESSASSPGTVYLTLYERLVAQAAMGLGTVNEVHPRLATSEDGGDTWTITDIEPGIGNVAPGLAAVDPEDFRKLYLRVTSAAGAPEPYQGIAITLDAGATWTIPLKVVMGSLKGFARLSERILLAVGETAPGAANQSPVPALFRSDDGGETFVTEPATFHPIGLAQRDGTAFVVTPDFVDGFALTSSADDGHTWTPRLRFREIYDLKECVRSICGDACDKLAGLALFPPEVCTRAPTAKAGGGCRCQVGDNDATELALSVATLAICLIRLRRRAGPFGPSRP